MPWVRVDDRFPSHRKVAPLSDRAFRLYVSALCWCSENLTEGVILDAQLKFVARVRNMTATARELEAADLWERIDGGWLVHDFLEYNPDRRRVEADRAANAARQQAHRDRKRAERDAKQAAEEAARNAERNAVTNDDPDPEKCTTATRNEHDGDTTATRNVALPETEPQVSAIRNAVSNGTPSPTPTPLPPTEVELASTTATSSRVPPASRALVDALTRARLIVGWDLSPFDWFTVEALVKAHGVDVLVVAARGMWDGARTQPRSGTYFIPGWKALEPTATPEPEPQYLPAVTGGNVVALPAAPSHNASTIANFRNRHRQEPS